MSGEGGDRPGPDRRKSRNAVIQTLQEIEEPPCLSVGDIADRVEFSRRTVISRVTELAEDGVIQSGNVGGNNVYWIGQGIGFFSLLYNPAALRGLYSHDELNDLSGENVTTDEFAGIGIIETDEGEKVFGLQKSDISILISGYKLGNLASRAPDQTDRSDVNGVKNDSNKITDEGGIQND